MNPQRKEYMSNGMEPESTDGVGKSAWLLVIGGVVLAGSALVALWRMR